MIWTGPEGQPADRPIHTVPVGDIRDHVMDGLFCPCMPRLVQAHATIDDDGVRVEPDPTSGVIVHNSYDRREVGEVCRSALDKLGIALANIDHEWSHEERSAYDHAIYLLGLHWPKKLEPR